MSRAWSLGVGARVSRFTAGNEVYARLEKMRMGGLAERVAADESVVALKPARASFAEAAAVPLAALTSLQALRESAALQPGQRVLIHAGAGGVGTLAIQIAKILGLWVATTTSTKNIDFVKSLGADEVIDYTKERLPDRVRELDAVFDTLGASELESLSVVKRGGVVVGIGGLPDVAFARDCMPWWAPAGLWLATTKRRRAARSRGRAVRLLVHATRWRATRRARELDRRRQAEADRAPHVSARRVSRGVRGARARPRARQDRRDDLVWTRAGRVNCHDGLPDARHKHAASIIPRPPGP